MTVTTCQSLRALFAAQVLILGFATGCTKTGIGPTQPGPSASPEGSASVYLVTQEGLTKDQAQTLAKALDVQSAIKTNGEFHYVGPTFEAVPTTKGETGVDESGRATVAESLDLPALAALRVVPDDQANQLAGRLVEAARVSPDLKAQPSIGHTMLTLSNADGAVQNEYALDTTVSYGFTLGGLPVTGPGAKLRIAISPQGKVTQVSDALRQVKPGEKVNIIDAAEAVKGCAVLFPSDATLDQPSLVYYFPHLQASDASGKGPVMKIFPQYACTAHGRDGVQYSQRLLPAVKGAAPEGTLSANLSAGSVRASVKVSGGTAPYTYRWSTSGGVTSGEASISYSRKTRDGAGPEVVAVEITDANGLSASASVELRADGDATAAMVPGGGGLDALAAGRDAGVENAIGGWACAHQTVQGFRDVMASHGTTIQFDWRGTNAWETDFKDDSLGGHDSQWVDNVDIVWYIGHGGPGGFTFESNHDDGSITPNDARWGNGDLEWLQLESCQVLADTNGNNDYFSRWGKAFKGLHMLNGFHTVAYCPGTTGGTFAGNLFAADYVFWSRPAMTVRQAWGATATAVEPKGVVYRSMGPIGTNNVTNTGDYYWDQGTVGPDITAPTGFWAITGTV